MTPPGVPGQLRQVIHYHLDNGFHDNALFLAGRLHALENKSAESSHLLALCCLRLGRYKAAHDYSKYKNQHTGCAYVFAQACLALERHEAGAQALERTRGQWVGRNHWSKFRRPRSSAYVPYYILTRALFRQTFRHFTTAHPRRRRLLRPPREAVGWPWRHEEGR